MTTIQACPVPKPQRLNYTCRVSVVWGRSGLGTYGAPTWHHVVYICSYTVPTNSASAYPSESSRRHDTGMSQKSLWLTNEPPPLGSTPPTAKEFLSILDARWSMGMGLSSSHARTCVDQLEARARRSRASRSQTTWMGAWRHCVVLLKILRRGELGKTINFFPRGTEESCASHTLKKTCMRWSLIWLLYSGINKKQFTFTTHNKAKSANFDFISQFRTKPTTNKMYYSSFMRVGVVLLFLAYLDIGTGRPSPTGTTVTANDLRERALRHAESGVRGVIINCTKSHNDSDVLECLQRELQGIGVCSTSACMRQKTNKELAAQYMSIEQPAFILSDELCIPGMPQYIGVPNRAYVAANLRSFYALNPSCFRHCSESYEYRDLGEGYFPRILMVVSNCSSRVNCDGCTAMRLTPASNNIQVLKRDLQMECDSDGSENWTIHNLQPPDDGTTFPLACSCAFESEFPW